VASVSRARLRAELELTLAERRVAPALLHLQELVALPAMFGLTLAGVPYAARDLLERLDEFQRTEPVPWEAYLLALLVGSDSSAAATHIESFNWALRLLDSRERIARMAADPDAFTDDDLEGLDEAATLVLRVA